MKNIKYSFACAALLLGLNCNAINIDISNLTLEESVDLLEKNSAFVPENTIEEMTLKEIIMYRISENEKIKMLKEDLKEKEYILKEKENAFLPTIDLENSQSFIASETLGTKGKTPDEAKSAMVTKNEKNFQLVSRTNLYNGGYDFIEIKKAKINIRLKKIELMKEYNKTIMNILQSYIKIVFLNKKIQVSEKVLEKLKIILNTTEEKKAGGIKSKEDVQLVKSTFFNISSEVIQYKTSKIKEENLFDLLVGEDLKMKITVYENYIKENIIEEKMLKNLKNNIDYLANTENIKLDLLTLESAKTKFKPKLNFEMKYTNTTSQPHNKKAFAESSTNAFSAKLSLSYNLYNGGRDQLSYKKSLIRLSRDKINEKYLHNNIEYKIKNNYLSLNNFEETMKNKLLELQNIKDMITGYNEINKKEKDYYQKLISAQKNYLKTSISILDLEEKRINDYFLYKETVNELLSYFDLDILNTYKISTKEKSILKSENDIKEELNIRLLKKKSYTKDTLKKELKKIKDEK